MINVTSDEYIAVEAQLKVMGKGNVIKKLPKPEGGIKIQDYYIASGLKKEAWCKALDISKPTWDKYVSGVLPVKPERMEDARRVSLSVRAVLEGLMTLEHEAVYHKIYELLHPHPEQDLKAMAELLDKQEDDSNG